MNKNIEFNYLRAVDGIFQASIDNINWINLDVINDGSININLICSHPGLNAIVKLNLGTTDDISSASEES